MNCQPRSCSIASLSASMSRIDLNIPSLGNKFADIRDTMPGDSFNWSWIRPLSQVKYLAIHHSAASDIQTPTEIANFHIKSNGWGGIGYHFLVAKDGTVYYVGDIGTARANVEGLNEQVIGICLVGNFIDGNLPSAAQLDSTNKLCNFLVNFTELSNVNSRDSIRAHSELPGQSTTCPGDSWGSWKENLFVVKENKDSEILKSQIDNLQTTLASVHQQVITLQEAVREKDQEISDLRNRLLSSSSPAPKVDTTLTIIGVLILLYKFIFRPGKEAIL